MESQRTFRSLGLLIKPASGHCQMRCRYCFYENVSASRATADYGRMKPETLERLVERAISETTGQCTFSFQGGEPTLVGLDFYRSLVALQRRFQAQYGRNRLVVSNVIQTNGLLLDDEWAAFFAKERFLVGLSLDGDRDLHDANRVDAAGKGTYARVLKAARLLERHGAEFNILCVVTRSLARRGRHVYRALVKEGFRYLQFIPCIEDFGNAPGASPHSLTADRFGEFLKDVFDEWHRDLTEGRYVSIRHFDNWVRMLQGIPPETCAMSGTCTCYGVVEADGGVYPCDFYVLDAWRLGNLHDASFAEMLAGERAERFVAESRPVAARCRTCRWHPICRGGCRRDREPLDPAEGSLNVYCAAYEAFFESAMPRLEQAARMTMPRGGSPTDRS